MLTDSCALRAFSSFLRREALLRWRAELHEGLGFDVETGDVAVDDGLPDDAEAAALGRK